MFNVMDFGAKADINEISTKAFQKAVDACEKQGGGTVYVPFGEFVIGTVFLCDNVHFVFEAGAKIFGSENLKDFAPREKPEYPLYQDASHSYFDRSMFVAKNKSGITFTGFGTIDMREIWESEPVKGESEWNARRAIKIFAFKECKDVSVTDLTLLHSTDLALYLAGCERAKVREITIDVNIDGISPECCKNVIISDCIIRSGDDGIVLKSSYTLGETRDCENVVISNCTVTSRCSAIKLGTESNGGFKNITIGNCSIYDTYYGAVSIESTDGGDVDGITVSNIVMKNVGYPFFIILSGRLRGPKGTSLGSMKNITVSNITASGPYVPWLAPRITALWRKGESLWSSQVMPSTVTGQPDKKIENVSFSNVFITTVGGGRAEDKNVILPEITEMYPENYQFGDKFPVYGMYFRHVKGLTLSNVRIETVEKDERNAFAFVDVEDLKTY